jgi:hypothetical protein
MALSVAERASKMGVPLADIPSFSLTEKGKERLPSDRNLWKPYFDYYDLPGNGGYLSYTQKQVDDGKLPAQYLQAWQTYQKLKTDFAKDAFRKNNPTLSKDLKEDFRRKNPSFDKWLVAQEYNQPLKPKTVARVSSGRSTIASGVSFSGGVSSRGTKKSYPKFKKLRIKTGMNIRAPKV